MPISPFQCNLLSLPNEVLIEILFDLPIKSILSLESTCKSFYQLCRSRPVWQNLMRHLDVEEAPDLHPFQSLESLPTPDLRRRVISAVRRHETWYKSGEVPALRVIELPLPHLQDERIVKTRLLPGGREIILESHGNVELWSVESRQCLWVIEAPDEHVDYVGFDYQLVHDGKMVIIATVSEDVVFPSTSLCRLHAYDFARHTCELFLERRMPLVSPSRMMLQGDFFISCIPRSFQTVVINWKTGEALIVDFMDPTGVRIDARAKVLADGNLIAFVHQTNVGFCAVKLPLSLLRESWSAETDHNTWRHVVFDPSATGYSVLPLPFHVMQEGREERPTGFGPWVLAHHVFTPTWQENPPTEILVFAYTCGRGGETPIRIVSYRLQLSRAQSTGTDENVSEDSRALSLVSSTCSAVERLPRNPRSISNAGLVFCLRQQLRCFSLFSERQQPINEAELSPDIAPYTDEVEPNLSSVDPWSGAIAIRMPEMMKIVYFD